MSTSDGGKTWIRQNSGTDRLLSSISFPDKKNGWAVGDGGTIIHTADGGQRWTKQKSPVETILLGVHFADAQKGWAVGEKTIVLHTKDGGANWSVQFQDEGWTLRSVSFTDSQNGWAAGEYGYIYHTSDGGNTWKKEAGSFGISEETSEIVAENFLFNIKAINQNSAAAVGIDGCIKTTTNGGASWTNLKTNVPQIHLFGVIPSEGRLLITGRGILLAGSMSGGEFKPVKLDPSIPYGYLYGITRRGEAGFVAVGKGGCVYLSDRSGMSWKKSESK